jgi:mono/diheme cytochrome c family protein
MRAAGGFVAGLLFAVLVSVAAALWYARSTGLTAIDSPSPLEARTARRVRAWAIPEDARIRQNPRPRSAEVIAAGRSHFADHCASCHGNDGSGDVQMGKSLFPKSPDMRLPATQDLTDGELFWIIENGIRFTGMPGWRTGTAEGEQATWELVHFIRHLPGLTDADIEAMKELNPRPPAEIRRDIEAERFLQGLDR